MVLPSEKVEKLSKMEQQGIIFPVQHSHWAVLIFQRVMVPLGSAAHWIDPPG